MFVKLGAENHKEELATYVDIPPFLICLNVSLLDYVYFFLSLLSTAAPSPTATQKLVANYRYNCNGSHPLIDELYSLASIWKCKRLSDPHQLEIHQQGFSFIAWCLIDKFFSIVVAWCANRCVRGLMMMVGNYPTLLLNINQHSPAWSWFKGGSVKGKHSGYAFPFFNIPLFRHFSALGELSYLQLGYKPACCEHIIVTFTSRAFSMWFFIVEQSKVCNPFAPITAPPLVTAPHLRCTSHVTLNPILPNHLCPQQNCPWMLTWNGQCIWICLTISFQYLSDFESNSEKFAREIEFVLFLISVDFGVNFPGKGKLSDVGGRWRPILKLSCTTWSQGMTHRLHTS